MGTLGLSTQRIGGVMAPINEQMTVAHPNVRPVVRWYKAKRCSSPELNYKPVGGSSMEGFGPPFSTKEACSKT
jgi:hypothetical protein